MRKSKFNRQRKDFIKEIDIDEDGFDVDDFANKPFRTIMEQLRGQREPVLSLFTSPATMAKCRFNPTGVYWAKCHLQLFNVGTRNLFKVPSRRRAGSSANNSSKNSNNAEKATPSEDSSSFAGNTTLAKRPRLAETTVNIIDIINDWSDSGDDDDVNKTQLMKCKHDEIALEDKDQNSPVVAVKKLKIAVDTGEVE